MGRVLLCLVCITAMMSSVLSQRSYYQHSSQFSYSANPYDVPQARNIQYSHPITVNLYSRTQEARKHKLERIQEPPRIENGTYSQISKRGTLEKYGTELNDRVVFPGPTSNEAERPKKPKGPQITEECRRRGYCIDDEVRDYPYEAVNNLVAKIPEAVKKSFQMDLPDDDIQIAQRLGGSSSEQEIPLCTINETILYPKSLPDKDGKWWFVLNQDGKPLQGFLAELCKTENTSCNPVANFQDGYKGTCKQKYVYRMVEALNDDRNSHSSRLLRLPGCCSCVVTTVNPFSR